MAETFDTDLIKVPRHRWEKLAELERRYIHQLESDRRQLIKELRGIESELMAYGRITRPALKPLN